MRFSALRLSQSISASTALLLALSGASAFDVAANGQLDQVLSNMQRAAKQTTTFTASLRHEKRHTQIGGKPEVSVGKIFFRHAGANLDRVRISYDTSNQVVVVDGTKITLYQPRIKQAIITSRKAVAQENQEFSFFEAPYTSIPELKRRFEVTYAGNANVDSRATSVVELTPKTQSSAKKLTLWVDHSTWLPIKYQVIEHNGTMTTFTLSDVQLNIKLANDVFKITWPNDTKVIKR